MILEKLYSKSKGKKLIEWSITVKNNGGTAAMEIIHGQVSGKLQTTVRTIAKGKNLGKANATTPYEQACSEATSLWNKQRDKGYRTSETELESVIAAPELPLPMLAHVFADHGHKIVYPAACQYKYDGARTLAKKEDGKVTLWSRGGKVFTVPTKIIQDLETYMKDGDMLDGEIYVHGWGFQRIISALKAHSIDTDHLEYFVYDRPVLNKSFKERFIETPIEGGIRVNRAPTKVILSEGETNQFLATALEKGYEGAIIRNLNSLYTYKHRSYDLQKLKVFEDNEFEIIGGKEGIGKDKGTIIFKCRTKDGQEFEVRPIGTHEERHQYWINLKDCIGRFLTVKHQGVSDTNIPRFPVGLHIREPWDK